MKLIKALIFLYKKIEEIIFPKCCLLCGKLIDDIICEKCENELKKIIRAKTYNVKNENIKNKIKHINENKENKYYFDKHIYLFNYENKIRKLIIDYKFNGKSYLYKIFSQIIIKNEKIYRNFRNYDIIIPVPIHKKRKAQRGYNQSELITNEIARNFKNLVNGKNIIKKIKYNVEQSSLNKEQRKQNVKNVYKIINKEKIKNKNIILFDDIYTTGNTVNEISKILKENEAKKILVLTLSKD